MLEGLIADTPTIGVNLLIVILFLKHITRIVKDWTKESAKTREVLDKSNHIHGQVIEALRSCHRHHTE